MVINLPDLGASPHQLLLVVILAIAVTIHLAKRRRGRELIHLEHDDPEDADKAYNRGWRIDRDGWWWRRMRVADPEFQSLDGFTFDNEVYVPTALDALNYDMGQLPTGEHRGGTT